MSGVVRNSYCKGAKSRDDGKPKWWNVDFDDGQQLVVMMTKENRGDTWQFASSGPSPPPPPREEC